MISTLATGLLKPLNARALDLDEFLGDGVAAASVVGDSGAVVTSTLHPKAVGGVRTLYAVKNTFGAGVTRIETFPDPKFAGNADYSLGYTQGAHTGQGIVTWDGDQSASLKPNGLGSIDLTQDGGTVLRLGMKFFDFPSSQSVDITIRLYDSSNTLGLRYSDVTITLDKPINTLQPFPLEIPFSRLTTSGLGTVAAPGGGTFQTITAFGPGGGVNVTRLGAVQLIVNGLTNSNAPDLTIDYLKTNGRCSSVPNAQGTVVDSCGVCLESPEAGGNKDSCGLCLAGPPSYVYTPVTDQCGLCPSAPNYNRAKDQCGVCFGNGSTCADCAGVPNGGASVDVCGVCGGAGSSCLDCRGTPFGPTGLDLCGVCGGDDSSCRDCAGTPLGASRLDACGICGGNVTDTNVCRAPTSTACVTVAATREVLGFQKSLLQKAQLAMDKFKDELRRSVRNRCGVDTRATTRRMTAAYNLIRTQGQVIFSKGVEVCGDSCVTVSFAEQVAALNPQFRILERETVALATSVNRCFARKQIKSGGSGKRGVAQTFKNVRTGLTKLIADCRASKVCPPK